MKAKAIKELRQQLCEYEQDIIESVTAELKRINRTVKMHEFNFVPFADNVQPYIHSIKLNKEGQPVCEVSFNDMREKYLSSIISDNEIDHWDMIALLGLLNVIPNKK